MSGGFVVRRAKCIVHRGSHFPGPRERHPIKPRCAITVSLVVFALFGVVAAAFTVQTMVPFTPIAHGGPSQILEPRQVVVRTTEDWRTMWRLHSVQPVPDVDFSKATVAGVFRGSRPMAGFRVEITAVRSHDAATIVHYTEHQPAPGSVIAQVLTSPFDLVAVARDLGTSEFRSVHRR